MTHPFFLSYDGEVELFGGILLYLNLVMHLTLLLDDVQQLIIMIELPVRVLNPITPLSPFFLSTPLNNIPTLFSVKDPLSLSFLFISGGIFPCEWRWDFFFVFKSKPLSCTNGKCLSSSLSAIIQKRTTVPTDIMKLARAR